MTIIVTTLFAWQPVYSTMVVHQLHLEDYITKGFICRGVCEGGIVLHSYAYCNPPRPPKKYNKIKYLLAVQLS